VAVTRRTRLGIAVASTILAAGLTGCGVVSPDMTAVDYEPGDGTMIIVEDVRALNLMIVSEGEGQNGVLIGAVANRGTSDQDVSITLGEQELYAGSVNAKATELLETDDPIIVSNVPAQPGAMVDMSLSVSGAGTQSESVPVVDGTLPAYAEVLEKYGAELAS